MNMRTDGERFGLESGTASTGDTPPFRDIPRWIWVAFLCAWASVFGLFILFFATDGGARFAVTIASLFALMAFGLPMAMAGLSGSGDHKCGGIIQTRSGPLSAKAAAAQIVLIPFAAVMGLTAFIALAK
ncbi:MAG TPA: hypothetical protein VFU80_08975 [Sphingomicrobium sp.]|nr:hypothetical protein [Sphingomicrobium sp.]